MASTSSSFPRVVSTEELLPDGTEILRLSIPGRPATKKTSQRIVRVGRHTRILPSERYERYEAHSRPLIEAAWRGQGKAPMDFGVAVEMRAVIDSHAYPDTVGLAQAAWDLLQLHGVVSNDCWIDFWSGAGHTISVDKENPRLELVIRRKRHPKEAYRAEQEVAEIRRQERAAKRTRTLAKT